MSSAERKKYAQIDREVLAIIIAGKVSFTDNEIRTVHKPLLGLFTIDK